MQNWPEEYDGNVRVAADRLQSPRVWRFIQWFRRLPEPADPPRGEGEEGEDGGQKKRQLTPAEASAKDVTAMGFNNDGSLLAHGDREGNVTILSREARQEKDQKKALYHWHRDMNSHDLMWDVGRSELISPEIKQIKFLPTNGENNYFLACNHRYIKLWKIKNKDFVKYGDFNHPNENLLDIDTPIEQGEFDNKKVSRSRLAVSEIFKDPLAGMTDVDMFPKMQLKIPTPVVRNRSVLSQLLRMYVDQAHSLEIRKLAPLATEDWFVSMDPLCVQLWNVNEEMRSFRVLDAHPQDPSQQLIEELSCIQGHPQAANLFMYGSSSGKLRLCDLRVRSLSDIPESEFDPFSRDPFHRPKPVVHGNEDNLWYGGIPYDSLVERLTSNVTDFKFSRGGRFAISRDLLTVKIWDLNMSRRPVETFMVHDYIRPALFPVVPEFDAKAKAVSAPGLRRIPTKKATTGLDKEQVLDVDTHFGLSVSKDGDIVTGSFDGYLHVYNLGDKTDAVIKLTKNELAQTRLGLSTQRRKVDWKTLSNRSHQGKPMPEKGLAKAFRGLFKGKDMKDSKEDTPGAKHSSDKYPFYADWNELDYTVTPSLVEFHPEKSVFAVGLNYNLYLYKKLPRRHEPLL